ncbi:hypothetical protein K3495_g7920 [Podosphaera aphanis]|nr:hypothetical protein K3495_g7920 [Podosphaera aphanis]
MPAQMSPSFATTAGQGSTRDSRNGGRSDSRGSGDWSRKDSRPNVNGTLTLRRSTNPVGQVAVQGEQSTQSRPESLETQQQSFEHPQNFRYSKQDLLDIYKHQQESGEVYAGHVSNLYAEGWAPDESQGSSSRTGWGKNGDGRDYYAPSFCWNLHGDTQPICLEEMTDQEKRLFNGDINSHMKPPQSQSSKDSTLNIRKPPTSLGQNSSNFSPVASRPGTRRQQNSDSAGVSLASPNETNKASRDDPALFFGRKFDSKEDADERLDDAKSNLNMEGIMRANPAGSLPGPGQASPWGSSSNAAIQPMGTFGNSVFPTSMNSPAFSDKRPLPPRTGNRFFQPSTKDNVEDLSKVSEKSWRPRQRTDTDPFADEDPYRGAALVGENGGHSLQRIQGLETPARESSRDFGMSEIPGFRDAFQREHSHNTPRADNGHLEPLSPSDTNPYRSPAGPDERQQQNVESYDAEPHPSDRGHGLGGIIESSQAPFGNIHRGFPGISFEGSDRSQTSSTTGSRALPQLGGGLPSLGAIGSLGGWLTNGNPSGTPDREIRPGFPSTFGSSIFGSLGESPGLVNVSGSFGSTPIGNASVNAPSGRGSKLGSLFPAAMQAQMQTTEIESTVDGDTRQGSAFGAIARNTFPPPRDNDSPMRTSRHAFDDLFPQIDNSRTSVPIQISENSQAPTNSSYTTTSQQNFQPPQTSESVPNQQLPTAQQRMMVMPDRMRWVYLDPQAQVQGPFSGLEMHDWYKASFFTPDLSVKKLEDADFEPLGQLIRRIGNSREPFLVPQIGIPHGPPSTQPGTSFTPPAAGHGPGIVQPGVVQPPFAGSFPSFGTTLTAEQQNNLERRKQEEQYLMARQREFLAQQQVNMKQMQIGAIPSTLHHSNVHNLQGQPSFGNISSPIGLAQQPNLPAGPGFFDGLSRQIPTGVLPGEFYRDEDLARLSLRDRHGFFNAPVAAAVPPSQSQQVGPLFNQANTQNQSPRIEDIDFAARLHEFEQLQEQQEIDEVTQAQMALQKPSDSVDTSQPFQQIQSYEQPILSQKTERSEVSNLDTLSMTQRVQKAATEKQSKVATASQPESPWANFNSNLPMPFPPSQSAAPLPAPTAQRGISSLPESLDVEESSRSRTPEVTSTTPSIAPWAKEPVEAPKALSLREIQEAEEKKVAKAEELAIATRRANYEQELKLLASQPAAPAPGLPTTATWGSTTSPVNSTPTKSAWAKLVTKTQTPASKQKTLADIQKEEELRKQKLAAVAATQSPAGSFGSKRYADLASHTAANASSTSGPAWSTVGAGGKVKAPIGPAASAQAPAARSASAHSITLPTRPNSKQTATTRSATTPATNSVSTARDEFTKWAKATLDKGLNPGINVNDFVVMLSSFPSESSIIADSIYSHSQTMNGNDFAMEFIRRRNNAEKGIIESVNSGSGTSLSHSGDKSGGWSEVAKKGPPKEEQTAGFKVVPSKKKGKK